MPDHHLHRRIYERNQREEASRQYITGICEDVGYYVAGKRTRGTGSWNGCARSCLVQPSSISAAIKQLEGSSRFFGFTCVLTFIRHHQSSESASQALHSRNAQEASRPERSRPSFLSRKSAILHFSTDTTQIHPWNLPPRIASRLSVPCPAHSA
jgi:hypothetical protein